MKDDKMAGDKMAGDKMQSKKGKHKKSKKNKDGDKWRVTRSHRDGCSLYIFPILSESVVPSIHQILRN